MKAIQVHQFMDLPSSLQEDGKVDALLSINGDVPKPTSLKKNQMLVRVLACSLSPGDVIMVQGNMIFMHQPFPFIPGMDICGEVVDSNGSANFKNDDVVVASNGLSPVGGMAEFMAIDMGEAAILPHGVSREQGASSSSAVTARNAVMDYVKAGDRVLILGGSGGVGSAAIQIAKTHAKASFVAVTSTQLDLCEELGADRVINYNDVDWWTVEEYQRKKFDVVIDTVGGGNFYGRAEKVLKTGKEGGTFVAVTGDDPQHLHDHVGRQRLTARLVRGGVVDPAFRCDVDARETEARQHPQGRPGHPVRKDRVYDQNGRDERAKGRKDPHMPHPPDHPGCGPGPKQEPDKIGRHHIGQLVGAEPF